MLGLVRRIDMDGAVSAIHSASSASGSTATMRRPALDWPISRAFASASSPLPTMTTDRPSTRKNTGKALSFGWAWDMRANS